MNSITKRMISAQLEGSMIHKIIEIQKKQILRTGKNASRNSVVVMLLELAFLLLHSDAGPVADELVGARQRVEQCRFTAVGVARKGNFDLLFHIMLLPVQALEPICKNL